MKDEITNKSNKLQKLEALDFENFNIRANIKKEKLRL